MPKYSSSRAVKPSPKGALRPGEWSDNDGHDEVLLPSTRELPNEKGSWIHESREVMILKAAAKATHAKKVEARLREAQAAALVEAAEPVRHGRFCLASLAALQALRVAAYADQVLPRFVAYLVHLVSTVADVICWFLASFLLAGGTQSLCVSKGFLGPLLTTVFFLTVIDMGALIAELFVVAPKPLPPGARSFPGALTARLSIWDSMLISSIALEIVLCVSCWRIYRILRLQGVYPPDNNSKARSVRHVSMLEIVCDEEDAANCRLCEVEDPPIAEIVQSETVCMAVDGPPVAEVDQSGTVLMPCTRSHSGQLFNSISHEVVLPGQDLEPL